MTETVKDISAKQKNNESLFRAKPPIDLVNTILKSMGLENGLTDSRTFTKDDLKEDRMEQWLPELESYYLPCKARRFLDFLTRDKFITIIRHIIRVHNFVLRAQEKVICGVKKTQYRIETPTPRFSAKGGIFIEFN
jgi:hypothetical protein